MSVIVLLSFGCHHDFVADLCPQIQNQRRDFNKLALPASKSPMICT